MSQKQESSPPSTFFTSPKRSPILPNGNRRTPPELLTPPSTKKIKLSPSFKYFEKTKKKSVGESKGSLKKSPNVKKPPKKKLSGSEKERSSILKRLKLTKF